MANKKENREAGKHEMHRKHKRYSSPLVDYWRKTQREEAEERKPLKRKKRKPVKV